MFVLSKGKSTATIVNSLSDNGVIISTTHYSVEKCSHGLHSHVSPHLCFLLQGGDIETRGVRVYERMYSELGMLE